MNETMSLLLATAVLAASGLGLYMYKSEDNNQKGGDDYNEDSLFSSGSFWDSNNEDEVIDEDIVDDYVPKSKAKGGKTKRNRKSGGTKRRY
jgi:hypothetical protein